ncbi:MAG: sulfite exporter TauE/SafE family protein, partial [Caldilineaceae bacterium]|nr:sulfite exporter TauE/SafE family protein [Caldilineaceae bacterium]
MNATPKMWIDALFWLTLAILFLAAFTKATLGFGESLLTIPMLTLVLGVQTAVPLVSLIAGTITLLMLVRGWQELRMAVVWRLILAALVGVPIGVWALTFLPGRWVTSTLGVMLIGVGLYYLHRPTIQLFQGQQWAYLFGFVAGILGGAYSMASPPVLIYGAAQRWPPEQFRVTLQGFFLPLSTTILISHALAGLWSKQVLQ